MAQHQMLCIVTTDAPAAVSPNTTRLLDQALRATGCVHFATLALLPGPPAPITSAGPSLMFEIVVDDGIDPRTAVEMMLAAGFLPLWQLYGHAWPGTLIGGEQARRQWLREHLLRHTEPAACGFIGARDRTVAQILAEGALLAEARQKFRDLSDPAGSRPPEREALAQKVLVWATNLHGALVAEPARRSLLRSRALPDWALGVLRGLWLVLPALALVAFLGWLGSGLAWLGLLADKLGLLVSSLLETSPLAPWLAWVPGSGMSRFAVPGLAALMLLVMLPCIAMLARFLEALPAMLVFGLIGIVSGLVLLAVLLFKGDLRPALCGVQLVGVGATAALVLAFSAATLALLVTLPLMRAPPHFSWLMTLGASSVAATLTYLSAVLAEGLLVALPCASFAWNAPPNVAVRSLLVWVVAGTVPVGMLLIVLPGWLNAVQAALDQFFKSKSLLPLQSGGPLHQVHPSIDECEARLTGRQSHMISLTEVRSPVWWHGTCLRLGLWVVNKLADVYFTDGRLGSADGIKFGHWRLIDGGRRLLFCSNYDGSFGGYLDEFIRGASQGANLIWRCTELRKRPSAAPGQPDVVQRIEFPPTQALILHGCKYEQAFKAYARASMVPHLHRFEAYNLSLQDIERATRFRDALSLPRHPSKMDQILRALES